MPERDVSTMEDVMEVIDETAGGISTMTLELIRIREALEWLVINRSADQRRSDLSGPILDRASARSESPGADPPANDPKTELATTTAPAPLTTETPNLLFLIEAPSSRSRRKAYLARFEDTAPLWTAELRDAMSFRSYSDAAALLKVRRELDQATVGIAYAEFIQTGHPYTKAAANELLSTSAPT